MDGRRCLLFLLLMLHSVLFSGACRFMAMHAADSKVKHTDYYVAQWDVAHLGLVEVAWCRPTTRSKGLA